MIFKIHYGLWYGALVGIIPFMFSYASEYSGATGTQHGILYTVLPFVALLAKPLICSVADKYAAHHHCLLFFISTTILGYGSLAIYPFIPSLKEHKNLIWILYCLAALIGNTSMCIVNSIGDSLAINSCQRRDVSYGEYRLWGPVGFGIFGAIWGIANEIPSMPKYTPGILTMVGILILNSLLIAFWYDKEEFKVIKRVLPTENCNESSAPMQPTPISNYGTADIENGIEGVNDVQFSPQREPKIGRWSLLWKLCRQETSIFGFLFLFTFCGIMTGIHWQFFFRYLEEASKNSNEKFSVVATLALPVQALGGELIFFMIANYIVRKIGSSMSLVICLFSFACRYLLYAYLIPNINIYWILLVELFQGPAFGLMYCVLTHQASYYSEKVDEILSNSTRPSDIKLKNSLHATLQGTLGASFEGLGLGLGAMIGGLAFDVTPILMWQIAGFSALAVSILCLIFGIIFPEVQLSDQSNNSARQQSDIASQTFNEVSAETNTNPNNGSPVGAGGDRGEGSKVEELRKIAKKCQDWSSTSPDKRPTMGQIKTELEKLKQNN